MAEVKEVQVGFRKTVSDGNYGNETHEARITITAVEGSGQARLAALEARDAASLFVADDDAEGEGEDGDEDGGDERPL
jgi:hypothetical protein